MRCELLRFSKGFRLACENERSQAAEMVLPPGEIEGGSENAHRGSDQWLFVVDGVGVAIVNDRRQELKPGVLLLIEKGETHEIRATGSSPLKTLNVYVPPAYQDEDTPRPAGKPP